MLYRNSWLPLGRSLGGKEDFIVVVLSSFLFLMIFDFYHLLSQDIYYYFKNNLIFLILFFLLFISTLIFNRQELTSKYYLTRYLTFIFYFIIYFVIFPKFLFQNPEFFRKFIFIIVCYGAITSFLGLFLLFAKMNPSGAYGEVAISYIWHPNMTAFVYTVSILATIYFFQQYYKNFSILIKSLIITTLILQILALLLTLCRAAVFGVVIGTSFYLCLIYKRKLLLIIPILVVLVPIVIERYFVIKGLASTSSRFLILIPAIQMILQSRSKMLWGYGITDSFDIYKKYLVYNGLITDAAGINNPHNTILQLIMMFGLIFTTLLLVYITYILIKVFIRSWRAHEKNEKNFFAFLFSSLLALIIHNLFDGQIIMPEFFCMQFFLIYLGLSHFYITSKKKQIAVYPLWKT
jgi:hypothetical protein